MNPAGLRILALPLTLLLLGGGAQALAQPAPRPDIPSAANIERFDDALKDEGEPRLRPIAPKSLVQTPAQGTQAVPEGAENITFVLNSVTVTGSTAYWPSALPALWQNDLGKKINVTRVYEIAAAITARYRQDGYVLSRAFVPAQEIDQGNITIAVVEGYIGDVSFEGENANTRIVKQAIADIKAQKPMNVHKLERNLLFLNDLSGVTYRAILKPAPNLEEGAVLLQIVEQNAKSWDGSVELNNAGSRYIGPLLFSATAGYNHRGAFAFHRSDVTVSSSIPTDEFKYLEINHKIPLNARGLSLKLNGSYSDGNPGYLLKSNDIDSHSGIAGIRLEWNAIRQRLQNLTFSFGFEAQNSRTNILSQRLSQDHIRHLELRAEYSWQDTTGSLNWGASNNIQISLNKGIDGILGASERGDIDLSRAQGRPDYETIEAGIYRLQQFPRDVSVLTGVIGQLSSGPLLSSKEFGYGGTSFGRAYDSSEIVGDDGFAAMIEARYDGLQSLRGFSIQPFLYADFGKVWNKDPGQPKVISGATTGGGLRISTPMDVKASLTLAKPLTKDIDAPQFGNGKSPRLLFSLSSEF